MAPGPPLEANRFSLLDTTKNKKRKSNSHVESFPDLPVIKAEDPKFITIEGNNEKKPLSSYSCFAIHRALQAISKDIISISQLRDGKLLLLVKNRTIANRFIATKALPGLCDITARFHSHLNNVKGTIYAPFLSNVNEKEIVEELSSAGVVEAYKFKRLIDGKEVPTGVVLLTFDLYSVPANILVAWTKVRVQQFFPSPMRCKSCQSLGHTAKYCTRAPTCVTCGLPPHSPSNCSRICCVNCSDKHPANSKDCTKFQQAKEILKIKTINKCSMGEASKIYKNKITTTSSNSISFAEVLSNSNNKNSNKQNNNNEQSKNTTIINSKPVLENNSSHTTLNAAHGSNNDKLNNNSNKINSQIHTTSNDTNKITNTSTPKLLNLQTKGILSSEFEINADQQHHKIIPTTITNNKYISNNNNNHSSLKISHTNTLDVTDFEMSDHSHTNMSNKQPSLDNSTKTSLSNSHTYNLRSTT